MLIATYTSIEDGVEATVTFASPASYVIHFRDTDADATIGTIILDDKDKALAYAADIVAGRAPAGVSTSLTIGPVTFVYGAPAQPADGVCRDADCGVANHLGSGRDSLGHPVTAG